MDSISGVVTVNLTKVDTVEPVDKLAKPEEDIASIKDNVASVKDKVATIEFEFDNAGYTTRREAQSKYINVMV